ncbi:acyl-CoA dehydrogenase family protein [Kitasatospora albolonga]
MDAAFTAEQDEIRRTLRELLAKHGGPREVRAAVGTPEGHDPALWHRLARELGLPGLALGEEYGGAGCTATELALACEETGRALLPSPLLATAVLAAPLITALGTPGQRARLLPRIADGTLTAALAVPGGSMATALGLTADNRAAAWAGGGRAGGVQARRDPEGDGWRLYGEADRVLDGHSAGLLLVAAHTGGYPRSRTLLFLVSAEVSAPAPVSAEVSALAPVPAEVSVPASVSAPVEGLTRTRLTSMDETRPLARVELRDTPAGLLGTDDAVDGADVCGALADTGCAAAAVLAAEAVGAAAGALERTVAYVKEREQFGRAIGSFQAVKHRLADLYVRVEAARSAAYHAARDPAAGPLALAQALEAARIVAGEAVQLHGGIGFTWEHEAHLYVKRAAADELLFGPVHRLRDHAAGRAGLFGDVTSRSLAYGTSAPGAAQEASAPGAARGAAV